MSNNHKDGDFFWKINTGKGNMPSFKNKLAKNDIWDLVNFIQSLSKTKHSNH
jgi:mono/diheme cytochrome c family protein